MSLTVEPRRHRRSEGRALAYAYNPPPYVPGSPPAPPKTLDLGNRRTRRAKPATLKLYLESLPGRLQSRANLRLHRSVVEVTYGERLVFIDAHFAGLRANGSWRHLSDAEVDRIVAAEVLPETAFEVRVGGRGTPVAGKPMLVEVDVVEAARRAREALEVELQREVKRAVAPPPRQVRRRPRRKTRFHPLGNFVVYRSPTKLEDLPEFAVVIPPGVPAAFEDRRAAKRFIQRHEKHRELPEGCKVARVLGAVVARPVFRDGFAMPRWPDQIIDLVRKEPRIVKPELQLEWLPRNVQGEDGVWRPEEFKLRRTVRHGVRRNVYRELRQVSERMAEKVDDVELRASLGEERVDADGELLRALEMLDETSGDFDAVCAAARRAIQLEPREQPDPQASHALRIAHRAERVLPRPVLEHLGLIGETIAPNWEDIAQRPNALPRDDGHWIRAPFEFGPKHHDGLRARIVELRIDDLAGYLERFGVDTVWWMVKESTVEGARWVVPSTPSAARASVSHDTRTYVSS